MERMKIEDNDGINEIYLKVTIQDLEEENKRLEEENKKLNKKIENLQIEIGGLMGERDGKQMRIEELEEENKKLKKERDLYKARNEELNENCFGLSKENKKLKSDLAECECSFGFENDEVGFWKREYKRLKKWIKDHCKGYGNLFPEDEMKRQRKKADKKRKKTKEEEELSKYKKQYEHSMGEDDELIYEEGLYD